MKIFKIASSKYGGWLSPSGELIDVDIEQHLRIANKILQKMYGDEKLRTDANHQLYELGWIRLVYGKHMAIDVQDKPNEVQLRVIMEICEKDRVQKAGVCTHDNFQTVMVDQLEDYLMGKIKYKSPFVQYAKNEKDIGGTDFTIMLTSENHKYSSLQDDRLSLLKERANFPTTSDFDQKREENKRKLEELEKDKSSVIDTNFLLQFNSSIRGLVSEALKCKTFEEFEQDYLIQIKHGTYWHITNDPNFYIDVERGPRDMSSMGGGEETKGALMVTSDLSYWLEHYKDSDRKYVAEIGLSNVDKKDYVQVKRGFGNEFFIKDVRKVKVIRILSLKQARKIDLYRSKNLPGSKEELKAFYDNVWKKVK